METRDGSSLGREILCYIFTFWRVIKERRGRLERYKGVRPDGYLKTILCLLVYPWKLMCAFQALAIFMCLLIHETLILEVV